MRIIEPKPSSALGSLRSSTAPTVADRRVSGPEPHRTPLEFHCTAPVKPNRAQQILYGPTLEPYLFGEQIGQSLLSKAAVEPEVICTDRPPALASGVPRGSVALVLSGMRSERQATSAWPVTPPPTDGTAIASTNPRTGAQSSRLPSGQKPLGGLDALARDRDSLPTAWANWPTR